MSDPRSPRSPYGPRRASSPCSPKTFVGCPEHGGREVELYCDTCEMPVCYKCIKAGERHHSHLYEELGEAFEELMATSVGPLETQLMIVKKALVDLNARSDEIAGQQANVEHNIHETISRQYKALDTRKAELIDQLYQLCEDKQKALATQKDQAEITQAQLKSCLHFIRENFKTGNQGAAMEMKSTIIKQVKELTSAFYPSLLEPSTDADMAFLSSADLPVMIRDYGRIHKKGSPDPSKCSVTGKGMYEAAVGMKNTVFLRIFDSNNVPTNEPVDFIKCEIVSEIVGYRLDGTVQRRQSSQYMISYQPTIKGRHLLHIKVQGRHIRGSPFTINAKSPVEKLGTPIHTITGVWRPDGVAVNQKGEVVVAEIMAHSVSMFSPSGKKRRLFGAGQGQFSSPFGVVVDSEGCVLVTDDKKHCIQKFYDEKLIGSVGSEGTGRLQFQSPRGIACDANTGKIFVLDRNDFVQILSSDLSYIGSFMLKGMSRRQFGGPQHLACDSIGNVYVTDRANNCIQVFTPDGDSLWKIGRRGDGRGELKEPYGLAIDSNDRVYVSELGNSRVSVFTSSGLFITCFGEHGSGPGEFDSPTGVAVDKSGVVYVSDYFNNRVQIF